jgi:hypothetical protein
LAGLVVQLAATLSQYHLVSTGFEPGAGTWSAAEVLNSVGQCFVGYLFEGHFALVVLVAA